MHSNPKIRAVIGAGIGVFATVGVGLALSVWLVQPAGRVGLIMNEPDASEGYTLLAPIFTTTTYLIDMQGQVVNAWKSDFEPGQVAYLLENGNLLRTGSLARDNRTFGAGGGTGGRVQEFTWNGELVWDFEFSNADHLLHHDVAKLPNGNILMIAWERIVAQDAVAAGRKPELQRSRELWPDFVIEVRPTGKNGGEIVWQWRVWDHLIQDHDPNKPNFGDPALHPELINVNHCLGWTDELTGKEFDKLKSLGYLGSSSGPMQKRSNTEWTHINSIAYNAKLDQIALSVLGFNEIWIIDHSTTTEQSRGHSGGRGGRGGDLLYRWGNPLAYLAGRPKDQQLFAQHDAHWIQDGCPGSGHILLFNNGRHRPTGEYSSVDELVLPMDDLGRYSYLPGSVFGPEKPIWSYAAPTKTEFFSLHISGAQRLRNGNTLICSGANGTIFEVTPAGKTVWKYVNPISRSHRSGNSEGRKADGGAKKSNPSETGASKPARPVDEPTNTVFRAYRYPPDYPGLIGRELRPGEKLTAVAAGRPER